MTKEERVMKTVQECAKALHEHTEGETALMMTVLNTLEASVYAAAMNGDESRIEEWTMQSGNAVARLAPIYCAQVRAQMNAH